MYKFNNIFIEGTEPYPKKVNTRVKSKIHFSTKATFQLATSEAMAIRLQNSTFIPPCDDQEINSFQKLFEIAEKQAAEKLDKQMKKKCRK